MSSDPITGEMELNKETSGGFKRTLARPVVPSRRRFETLTSLLVEHVRTVRGVRVVALQYKKDSVMDCVIRKSPRGRDTAYSG